jgi:hypothetical protein
MSARLKVTLRPIHPDLPHETVECDEVRWYGGPSVETVDAASNTTTMHERVRYFRVTVDSNPIADVAALDAQRSQEHSERTRAGIARARRLRDERDGA